MPRFLDRRAELEIEAMLQREELARQKQADMTQPADQAGQVDAADQAEGKAAKRPGSARRLGDWQSLVEQRIAEGMEHGMFDNLQGAGQPLNLDADRFVPDEYKMAFRLLRSVGLTPQWIDLHKEIREDVARLDRFRAHVHERWAELHSIKLASLRTEYAQRVKSINDKILNYNLIAPSSQVHLAHLIEHEQLAAFDQGPQVDVDG